MNLYKFAMTEKYEAQSRSMLLTTCMVETKWRIREYCASCWKRTLHALREGDLIVSLT